MVIGSTGNRCDALPAPQRPNSLAGMGASDVEFTENRDRPCRSGAMTGYATLLPLRVTFDLMGDVHSHRCLYLKLNVGGSTHSL